MAQIPPDPENCPFFKKKKEKEKPIQLPSITKAS
jgi:hypothetical protein